jgi:hypothetical protein
MITTGKFLGLLFQSRDKMHIAHLQTTSFAEHKALGGYYDSILDLTDKFSEVCFGRNKRTSIVIPESKIQDSVEHMKEMQKLLEDEREGYTSELQNIIDEMIALVNQTLYLLTLS